MTHKVTGFTVIEMMIVVATIAILVSLAVPSYQDYTIRAKVAEGFSLSTLAKLAVSETCQTNPDLALSNSVVGYPANVSSIYIASIVISQECTAPTITVTTRETGAVVDPVFVLTGSFPANSGRIQWTCSKIAGLDRHLPAICRGSTEADGDDDEDDEE